MEYTCSTFKITGTGFNWILMEIRNDLYPNLFEFCFVLFLEDFLRFFIKFAVFKLSIVYWAPPFVQTLITHTHTHPRSIFVQYLRILLSSFGKEDFANRNQIFAFFISSSACSMCRWSFIRNYNNTDLGNLLA